MEIESQAQPRRENRTSRTRQWLRIGGRAACWLVAGYLLIVVVMMFLEKAFIFFPDRYPIGDWRPAGLAVEDAWFEAADGTRLHGWYVPHEDPRAAVLFCHGNAGNVTNRSEMLQILNGRVGVSVLIFDYRGYGRSEGRPDEPGVLADARAARAWLAGREQIGETDVVLLGRSLGGAVAVDLAARDGARGLVLEGCFSSIPDVAAYCYPWLPVRRMLRTRLDAAGKIGDYHGPLLQSHAGADSIIPIRLGRRLFEAAGEPKRLITLAGFDHNDPPPMWYYDELAEFLDGLDELPSARRPRL